MQLIHPPQSCQKADWSFHKPECSALQRWAKAAPSDALGVPNDAVRCLGRVLWQLKSRGLDSGWVSHPVSVFFVLMCFFSQKKYRQCNPVGFLCRHFRPIVDRCYIPDKVAPQQFASVEAHTHLAHSVVGFLGLTAPSDLEEYGIMSAGDLVNMISRVRIKQVCHSFLAHSVCPSSSRTRSP